MEASDEGETPRSTLLVAGRPFSVLPGFYDFVNHEAATLGLTIHSGELMDKDFIATLRRLKEQAAEAKKTLLSHLLSVAELEAKSSRKAG